MGHGRMLAGQRGMVGRGVIAAGVAALAAVLALLVTGGSGTDPAPDHGTVVARLPIPFRVAGAAGKTDVIAVRVRAGQRFSIWVDAVDYYAFWRAAGTRPDPQVVRAAGEFADGTCPAQVAGCAIPYLYTFVARHRGTTTMTWQYRQGYTRTQPSVTRVAVDITVR
jgi:hypothetical protein